jgi:hypothetical protein
VRVARAVFYTTVICEGCLSKWAGLDERTRSRAYLVVDTGRSGLKRTFNGTDIAKIAFARGSAL